ncbi:MAG: ComEC/Rec2 family competence protein [candidate division WOR-3 bacterium]|nr:MAG: ComEC/Rec2 family competence protein [candidate division WOR-3 bacterium]
MDLVGRRVEGTGMRFAAVRVLVAFALGVLATRVEILPWWAGLAGFGLGFVLWRWTRGFSLYLALAGAAFLYASVRQPMPIDQRVYEVDRFCGVVVEEPVRAEKPRMTVELVDGLRGKVTVWLTDTLKQPEYGDLVEVRRPVEPFSFPRNPGVADLNAYYESKGFVGQTSVSGFDFSVWQSGCGSALMRKVFIPLRRYVSSVAAGHLPQTEAGLLAGLLLGDRSGIDLETRQEFTDAGVVHVLAVSGLHVGIVVGTAWLLLSVLGLHGWWKFWLGTAAVVGYIIMTGARPSTIRAGVLAIAFLLSWPTQRRSEPQAAISVAGLVLLVWQPDVLFDIGLQLSFSAAMAIALVVYRWQEKMYAFGRTLRGGRLVRNWLVVPLAVALAASLGTAPLLLHHFSRVQLLAPISSLPAVLLVSAAIPLGLLVSLVDLLSPLVAGMFAETLRVSLAGLVQLSRFFGRQTWAIVEPGRVSWLAVLWAYGLMVLAWNWRRYRMSFLFFVLLGVGLNAMLWQAALSRPQTKATFLDPGTGDAVLLEDSLGRKVLVDAGVDRERVLRDYLRSRGIRTLDLVIVTHPDLDHYGGLLDLGERVRVRQMLVSTMSGEEEYLSMLERYRARGTNVIVAGKGTEVKGFGYGLEFMWPEQQMRRLYAHGLASRNLVSLVCRASFGEFDMLLTGDMDDPGLLVDQDLASELLKSPHHGSKNCNREQLYELVAPDYVVVMGRYPTPASLEQRLGWMGDRYVNTRRDGAWVLQFDQDGSVRPAPWR